MCVIYSMMVEFLAKVFKGSFADASCRQGVDAALKYGATHPQQDYVGFID